MRTWARACVLVLVWATVAAAKPLLVQWDVYQHGETLAERLAVYRNENGGAFRLVKTFNDLTATAYLDSNVKWQRRYCYRLVAQTANGTPSNFSAEACGRPNK